LMRIVPPREDSNSIMHSSSAARWQTSDSLDSIASDQRRAIRSDSLDSIASDQRRAIRRRERLGGMLNYYYRAAA
jgi:hypothetical protein